MAYDNDRVNTILVDGDHNPARLLGIVADILQTGISVPAPAGGSTEAKQDTQITAEQAIQAGVGAIADAAVTNPAISGSLIALVKGWLTKAAVYFPAALGQTTKSASFAVTLASDDDVQAKLGIVTETAPATDTASSGLNGRLQRIAQRVTSLIALLPTAIGRTTSAGSLSVVLASDDALIGIVTETAPATDTASSGLNGRLQRIAQHITSMIALLPTALGQGTMAASFKVVIASDQTAYPVNIIAGQTGVAAGTGASGVTVQRVVAASDSPEVTALGAVADAAVTNPASSASVIAALKGLLTRLGFTLTAASGVASAALRTVNSTDDPVIGATNETAPASDTATAGLNGRLQRIAQRITSLIALVPTALGQSTMANSFRVVVASDQSAYPVNIIAGQTGVAAGTGVSGATVQRVVSADDGGATTNARLLSAAASTNATSVKASAGVIYSIKCYVVRASACYLKIYNKASAPTVGTDTPVLTLILPAGSIPVDYIFPKGFYLATGIAYALTTAAADADTGALTAGDVVALNLSYR